jgi:polyisoprenoid-binding protein YceI
VTDFTGTLLLGPGSGRVLIKTGRAGLAARAGHDLTIEITRWSARVIIPNGGADNALAAASITAELDLSSLAVREGTGGAKPLTDKDRRDIAGTAAKILGTGSASFASTRVLPAASGGAIEGTLTLNGKTVPVQLQVVSPAAGRYRGSATIKQTDYGITPYSGFLGALKLRDEIGVEFETDLERASRE